MAEAVGSPFPGERPPRVLVVDDEPAIRAICRINLEAAGLAVVEASDGAEALALIRSEAPELVLLDVMMPRTDGWQIAAELAADPATSEIPVVFLSARAGREDRRQAFVVGGVGYIVKPFDPLELAPTLTDVLLRIARGERELLRDELAEASR